MIKGINVKESRGELLVGVKLDEFIASLQALPSKNGWVNLIFSPTKGNPQGYSHFIRPEKKQVIQHNNGGHGDK
jgi:hypothetical protein